MTDSKEPQRRVYEPPRLRRVELVPEEATLVACKSDGVGGPKVVSPGHKCLPPLSQCSTNAS